MQAQNMTVSMACATIITSCHLLSRHLTPGHSLAGQIEPINDDWGPEKDAGETLLASATVLSEAASGKILMCRPNIYEPALVVELSVETINYRGEQGYIVYGGRRDVPPCVKFNSVWGKGKE